jgi:hypothetical protein
MLRVQILQSAETSIRLEISYFYLVEHVHSIPRIPSAHQPWIDPKEESNERYKEIEDARKE